MDEHLGFLHSHPDMERSLGLVGKAHVIVDWKDWLVVRKKILPLPVHGNKSNCPGCGAPGTVDMQFDIKEFAFDDNIWYNGSSHVWECYDCYLK